MAMDENKKDYLAYYQKTKIRTFPLALNKEHDEKIIAWLENQKPYSSYIRNLVIADMQAHGIEVERKDERFGSGEYINWRKTHKKNKPE